MLIAPATIIASAGVPREERRPNARGKQPIRGSRHGQLADDERPAVECPEARHRRAQRHQSAAPSPHQPASAVGERRGRRRQCVGRHEAHHADGGDDVDDRGQHGADDGGPGNRAFRIADALGRNRGALEAEKSPQRQGHDRHQLAAHWRRTDGRHGEGRGVDEEQAARTHHDEREQLERGRDDLDTARQGNAGHVHADDDPDHGNGQQCRCGRCSNERRHEGIEVAHERNGQRRQGAHRRQPVAPRHEEPRRVAEGRARVGVQATGRGELTRQPCEHEGQHHRARGRDEPPGEAQPAVGGQGSGQQEDARPDHVAHHNRYGGPEAENARRSDGDSPGRHVDALLAGQGVPARMPQDW